LEIGLTGVVILVEVVSNTKFSDLTLAATLVGFGIVDYLLAPANGKIQENR